MTQRKRDFFISYTERDAQIAEWIAWQLEEENYSVVLQKWDFLPGNSFVSAMRSAFEHADKLIAVISSAYFKSGMAKSEWDTAFAKDPEGLERKLIPVRVEDFDINDLAKPRIYIDLVGCDKILAKQRLLEGVKGERLKPQTEPDFPLIKRSEIDAAIINKEREPRTQDRSKPYIPALKQEWTDKEKKDFIKSTFEEMQSYFQSAGAELVQQYKYLEFELEKITSRKFSFHVYANGNLKSSCKIWIGEGYMGNGIAFSEGFSLGAGDSSYNELLTVADKGAELSWHGTMGSFFRSHQTFDISQMTMQQACDYYWARFSNNLVT